MRVILGNFNTVGLPAFGGNKKWINTTDPKQEEHNTDTFVRREDNYTRNYRELLEKADFTLRKDENKRPSISASDIEFLLEIKDDNKFKNIITTTVLVDNDGNEANIFFYTDAIATRKLAKRLGDRGTLKKLLSQKMPFDGRTVFFAIARNDDVKKAKALQESLSAKEFKRFMSAKDYIYETPYSIAKENNGALKALLDPIFADET